MNRLTHDPIKDSMCEGLPKCAKCGRAVDSVERFDDAWNRVIHSRGKMEIGEAFVSKPTGLPHV